MRRADAPPMRADKWARRGRHALPCGGRNPTGGSCWCRWWI